MWCDSSQLFSMGGRAPLAALAPQEPRHLRDGGSQHIMSAQPAVEHYNHKDNHLSVPASGPHSGQISEFSLPSRTAYKPKGADLAQMAGDYQLIADPQMHTENKKREYSDKKDLSRRPRQAQSHRKEATFEYPPLSISSHQVYQTATTGSAKPEGGSGFIKVNVGEAPRSKDLEVLRSVEQASAIMSDVIMKSNSSVVKPTRTIAKDQNKEVQKGGRSQSHN